ncbi:hypothetical protein [Glaciecola sp. 1036]|uniref:hypothetical protein n=1 Tax=Alteromonadaceae TaxID=72275 RepID=UPI003D07D8E5
MKNKIVLSLILTFLLLCTIASKGLAEESQCSGAVTVASYKIYQPRLDKTEILELYRNKNTVAHYYPKNQITELYELNKAGQVKLTKYFNDHKRGIEYQPNDKLNNIRNLDWAQKYKLMGKNFLDNASQQIKQTNDCGDVIAYSITQDHNTFVATIDTAKDILTAFEITDEKGNLLEKWELQSTELATDSSVFLSQLNTYQTTDYADIGDDHTDPFLTKMVNLGFIEKSSSGFYHMDDKQQLHAVGEHSH